MARFVFFLLLIANVAFAAHLYFNESQAGPALPPEINRDGIGIVSVTDAAKAQQDALAVKRLAATLNGSACVDFAVKPADAPRAQAAFAAMNLGDRLSTHNVDEFTRFALTLPVQRDKRSAETLVANLKKTGVKDVSVLADNAVSLGVYSTEEAARKVVAELQAKAQSLVKDLQVTPRNAQPREAIFTVKEPDTTMVARLTIMQRDYEGSTVKAVTCAVAAPAPSTPPVVVTVPGTGAEPKVEKSPPKAKP